MIIWKILLIKLYAGILPRRRSTKAMTSWVDCSILFAPFPTLERRRPLSSTLTLERLNMATSHCSLASELKRRKFPWRYGTLAIIYGGGQIGFHIIQTHLSEYAALTRALVNFSTKKDGSYVRKWSGELPSNMEKFLEHHAVLNDVDVVQQTCM